MMDTSIRDFIKAEISKQVNVILSGQSGNNTQFAEDLSNLFPGMPTLPQRPVMHPYGLVSRAPAGTFQVTGRMGDHSGNRVILGHRDSNRPNVNQGEVQLYNQFGQAIYLANGAVCIGSATASDPAVLGNELVTYLNNLLTALKAQTYTIPGVGTTGTPNNAGSFPSPSGFTSKVVTLE